MKRFGMMMTDECEICGAVETVQHQLYECGNASRMRQYAKRIDQDLDVPDLYSLIEIGDNSRQELLKSLLIEQLIQIDRSKSLTFEEFTKQVNWYPTITKTSIG